jgi:hypothetical protein
MRRISQLFVGFSVVLFSIFSAMPASSHKRENTAVVPKEAAQSPSPWIQIANETEGVEDRLERRFIVGVFRGSDGQPLAGARVELVADMRTMPGVHKVPPVLFSPRGEPGTYAGSARLPMAGPWLFRIKVSGPVTGVVDFVDRVGEGSAGLFSAPSEPSLRLRDSLNLAARGLHFLGAAIWLGGLAMLAVLSVRGGASSGLPASPRTVFLWQVSGLALLLLTGAYNLFYNTPLGRLITLDDLRDILVQPSGLPYAGLLLFKLGAFLLLLGVGGWALWRWRHLPALTWVRLNVALGLLILIIGGALSYLHISIHSRPGF